MRASTTNLDDAKILFLIAEAINLLTFLTSVSSHSQNAKR